MATTFGESEEDSFIHHLAIKISRELNIINPNDLLARRVIDIASTAPSPAAFDTAASGFGLKRASFLNEIYLEITAHTAQAKQGLAPQPVVGIAVHDSEVLAPEPVLQGGLLRNDAVGVFAFTIPTTSLNMRSNIASKLLQSLLLRPHPAPPSLAWTAWHTRNARRNGWLKEAPLELANVLAPMNLTMVFSKVRRNYFAEIAWLTTLYSPFTSRSTRPNPA
jgi:hypothetical protein